MVGHRYTFFQSKIYIFGVEMGTREKARFKNIKTLKLT